MSMNKKAVEPLIAAVLLVVIVVTIGAVVMSLVQTYVNEGEKHITAGSEAIKCGRDVSIGVVLINGRYQICNASSEQNDMDSLNLALENTGTMDILDAQIRMIGASGLYENNSVLNGTLKMGSTAIINMTYDPEVVGQIRQVKIVPRISLPGVKEKAFCSDTGITITYVSNNCTTYD